MNDVAVAEAEDKAPDSESAYAPPGKAAPVSVGPASTDSAVRLRGVRKLFGAKAAVDDVTFRIPRGSVFGLIGPNGAGKTTTFSMMAGFLEPTEGSLEILGYSPRNTDELRGRLGVLPQDAVLPAADRVGDFLVYLGRLQGMSHGRAVEEARKALAEVEGRDWWFLKCGALSHGMAKRVQLAQALLGDPEVVLLDEPTAGLDPRVAYGVRQLVRAHKGKCTLIISSHNLHELEEICDFAAILDHGRLVGHGSIQELTASSQEIHVELAPGPPVPLEALRAIPVVSRVSFDEQRRDLAIDFSREAADAETVIGHVLMCLLQHGARISGVSKGRGLEQRVMELTAGER
jgi:ABC-type multidrug transport system ATPase subunit